MPATATPPAAVRVAAAVVCVQGALSLLFALALAWRAMTGASDPGDVLGEAAYFAVIGAAVIGIGVALLRGFRAARTPALVVQLLLIGVAWYTTGPSGRPEFGVPVGLVCLGAVFALLSAPARAWAEDAPE